MRFARSDAARGAYAVAIAASLATAGCRKTPADSPNAAPATGVPQTTAATVPHGDHNPHHGGVVSMKGDLHYEVVLDRTGRSHRLFFTDAIREDLPASIATDVALTIRRPNAPDEPIAMTIDEFGESWVGSGRAADITPATIVRVAFSVHHEPYWIDIPYGAPSASGKP